MNKLESIGILAGGIAHDFNNILSGILGFTELVKEGYPQDKQLQEDLYEIYCAGKRAAKLVGKILIFSQQQVSRPSYINIPSILLESIKILRASLPANIEIELDIDENVHPVFADPVQIQQVIMSICTNSSQAMAETGGLLAVTLIETTPPEEFFSHYPSLAPGRYLKLSFRDTGCGIDRDIIGSIFDPYFTTKIVGDGTGLGLAVTYSIIKKTGGDILVESQLGKGSLFTVFLPSATQDGIDAENSRASNKETLGEFQSESGAGGNSRGQEVCRTGVAV